MWIWMLGESVVRSLGLLISFLAAALVSCATVSLVPAPALDFFVPAGHSDPWNKKIQNWQARHGADPVARDNVKDLTPAEFALSSSPYENVNPDRSKIASAKSDERMISLLDIYAVR